MWSSATIGDLKLVLQEEQEDHEMMEDQPLH
jgi:hypothetical protein